MHSFWTLKSQKEGKVGERHLKKKGEMEGMRGGRKRTGEGAVFARQLKGRSYV